jgi:hypothetical protein
MPYCQTVFQPIDPENVEEALSAFTKENFVGGRAAYHLGNGSYSIDTGENDIRAIYDDENEVIRFFCRYEKEMPRYDKKLQAFACKHGIALNDQSPVK